jgi:hypothetical protein
MKKALLDYLLIVLLILGIILLLKKVLEKNYIPVSNNNRVNQEIPILNSNIDKDRYESLLKEVAGLSLKLDKKQEQDEKQMLEDKISKLGEENFLLKKDLVACTSLKQEVPKKEEIKMNSSVSCRESTAYNTCLRNKSSLWNNMCHGEYDNAVVKTKVYSNKKKLSETSKIEESVIDTTVITKGDSHVFCNSPRKSIKSLCYQEVCKKSVSN